MSDADSRRKHAGLAYVVCGDPEAAARLAARVDGSEFGGRRLGAALLGSDSDDLGRLTVKKKKRPNKLSANSVAALAEREALTLDSPAIEALRSKPHALVSKALAEAAKSSEKKKKKQRFRVRPGRP